MAVLGNVASIQARGAGAAAQAKEKLMGVASELQQIGVIGDEVTLAGMQQLATFQLSEKEIATLAGGMTEGLRPLSDHFDNGGGHHFPHRFDLIAQGLDLCGGQVLDCRGHYHLFAKKN